MYRPGRWRVQRGRDREPVRHCGVDHSVHQAPVVGVLAVLHGHPRNEDPDGPPRRPSSAQGPCEKTVPLEGPNLTGPAARPLRPPAVHAVSPLPRGATRRRNTACEQRHHTALPGCRLESTGPPLHPAMQVSGFRMPGHFAAKLPASTGKRKARGYCVFTRQSSFAMLLRVARPLNLARIHGSLAQPSVGDQISVTRE